MAELKRKNVFKKVLVLFLSLLSVVGGIFGVKALVEKAKEDKETVHSVYAIGAIGEDGTFVESDKSIYTKKSFKAKGLEVKLDFSAKVTYQVYWYDEIGNFLSSSEVFDENKRFDVPLKYEARLVIYPIFEETDEDQTISWYEIASIQKQVEIKVDKDQEELSNITSSDDSSEELNSSEEGSEESSTESSVETTYDYVYTIVSGSCYNYEAKNTQVMFKFKNVEDTVDLGYTEWTAPDEGCEDFKKYIKINSEALPNTAQLQGTDQRDCLCLTGITLNEGDVVTVAKGAVFAHENVKIILAVELSYTWDGTQYLVSVDGVTVG